MVKTRRACLEDTRKITLVERDVKVGDDEVLVKIHRSYICGSELHYYRGKYPSYVKLPIYPGHEGGGIIEEVGPKVSGWSVGDRVIVYADVLITPSGADPLFADYAKAPARCLQPVSKDLDLDLACLAEPLACALQAIYNAGVRMGDNVAVFGLGFAGQVILQGMKRSGTYKLIGIDIVDSKLALAEKMGADYTINAAREDVVKKIMEITNGAGIDLAIEAVGSGQAVNMAAASLRKKGILALYGWITRPTEIDMNLWHTKGLEPRVTKIMHYSEKMIWSQKGFDLIKQGLLEVKSLVTHEFRLADIAEAFKKMDKDSNVIKVALVP